eukprot:1813256-Lingulodinium_polyedra.AAC.1
MACSPSALLPVCARPCAIEACPQVRLAGARLPVPGSIQEALLSHEFALGGFRLCASGVCSACSAGFG